MDRISILRFFLDLYKTQSGSSSQEPGEFIAAENAPINLSSSYKLKVKQYGKWKSRRITVEPLGDSSGSKSKCFKVIYDDVMVVKLPPVKIRSFFQYIEGINEEMKIVSCLQPDIECIVPTVSSIIKKVPLFNEFASLAPETLEQRCIDKLKKNPELQRFLRIGDSFAYFMNMSKYSFLSNVLEKMHDIKEDVEKEILKHGDVLWDMIAFDEKFGESHSAVFLVINNVFKIYEQKIHELLDMYGGAPTIPAYQIKDWFLYHLAERKIKSEDFINYPPGFIDDLPVLYDKVSDKHKRDIKEYSRMAQKLIQQRSFQRNKPVMNALVVALLKLLAGLEQKGVAIRDLKPENVFVIGDPDENPDLMIKRKNFGIGLIDFETSVSFNRQYDNKIKQPLLAGTPSYATPSHLFENELLLTVYKDLGRVFHFQDWQAAIGIIYNIVTGERLAEKTSRVLPQTIKVMRQSLTVNRPMIEVFKKSNRMFWSRAEKEFREKLTYHENLMKSVIIEIPAEFGVMLSAEIKRQFSRIQQKINRLITQQKFFPSATARKSLLESTIEQIERYREKWEKGINVPAAPPAVKQTIIDFLQSLQQAKHDEALFSEASTIIQQESPKIAMLNLVEIMFQIIYGNMYKKEWEQYQTEDDSYFKEAETELSRDEAAKFERTILRE